jgi:DNA modification methylase
MNFGLDVPGFHKGDARELLRRLEPEVVQCVVSSPPYWGPREYEGVQDVEWADGWKGSFGQEKSPEQYVEHTVEIFREIRRVLRKDGVLFWNVNDSFYTNPSNDPQPGVGQRYQYTELKQRRQKRVTKHPFLKPKDLCLIPQRILIGAQEDGWHVRAVVIWRKTNPQPESVQDRPTHIYEPILVFTRSGRYYWDAEAVRTTHNLWDVWEFGTDSFHGISGDHYAVYPKEIPLTCIGVATPPKVCSVCGKPWKRVVESKSMSADAERDYQGVPEHQSNRGMKQEPKKKGALGTPERQDRGFVPGCTCDGGTRPALVLDPFCGSGTTCLAADGMDRLWLGFDIGDYEGVQEERVGRITIQTAKERLLGQADCK